MVPGTAEQKTQQLVALAKDGDQSAVRQLCCVYGERVRRIVRLRLPGELRSKLESADVVQDALIGALAGLGDFTCEREGDFLRWLSKIAENKLRDNVRKFLAGKRDIRREDRLNVDWSTSGSAFARTPGLIQTTTPGTILAKSEELDRLERAIDQLKPEYRKVIVLTRIEELSHEEAGNQLGKSPDAVRKLLCRAMVALARVYEGM